MTRSFLDQPRVSTNNHLPKSDEFDTLPLPVIDPSDGYKTCLKLTEAAETLASEAEDIGAPRDSDGAVIIGDIKRDYIVIEQNVRDAQGNQPSHVINTVSVIARSRNANYIFRSDIPSDGGLAHFQVNEETPVTTSRGEFSGNIGSKLPEDAIRPTVQFTEAMIQVTDAICKEHRIGSSAREEVIEHLATPEPTQHEHPTKVMGSTALGTLLTNLKLYRSAA